MFSKRRLLVNEFFWNLLMTTADCERVISHLHFAVKLPAGGHTGITNSQVVIVQRVDTLA